jgi:hypothetical protein
MTLAATILAVPTSGASAHSPTVPAGALSVADAAARLYDAEINLHQARSSCVDAWISAAYDHLHRAVEAHAEARRLFAQDVSCA